MDAPDRTPLYFLLQAVFSGCVLEGDDEAWKELRIRIGASYHSKLIAMKVLRKKTMTDAIHEALDRYFADVQAEQDQGPSDEGSMA